MAPPRGMAAKMQHGQIMTVAGSHRLAFDEYRAAAGCRPAFLHGDTSAVLDELPPDSTDCSMSSPPYWGQRSYSGGGIGLEERYQDYIAHLLAIFAKLYRVLKKTGSFWLNIGDAYSKKNLLGLPWRVALAMTDQQGWVLRNGIVWNKVKGGPDNATDREQIRFTFERENAK